MAFCPFSRYRDILGVPGKGLHKYKFLGTSAVDYALSLISAAVTTYFTGLPLVLSTIAWLVVGIILHALFGLKTDSVRYLGLGCS